MPSNTTRPQVITDIRLVEFIQYLLGNHSAPSTLVICASKEAFIEQLLAASTEPHFNETDEHQPDQNENPQAKTSPSEPPTHDLLKKPSLLQLARSKTISLVFCPDLTNLRAYLATQAAPPPPPAESSPPGADNSKQPSQPLLAILNPITLHRPTTAFSAQGLSRTISLAVEAAHVTKRQLLIAECPPPPCHPLNPKQNEDEHRDPEQYNTGFEVESENAHAGPPPPPTANPWDEEISILNVTTKSFGAGGRGWVGRTVSVGRVVGRWCEFTALRGEGGG